MRRKPDSYYETKFDELKDEGVPVRDIPLFGKDLESLVLLRLMQEARAARIAAEPEDVEF